MNKIINLNIIYMKKILLSLFALLAVGSAMAQDVLWQEDFSAYAKDDVPADGAYNYVCVDGASKTKIYNENLAGGTAPELLIGKSGGSFSATVALNGKTGDFTLSYNANYDRVTVTVEGATLGDKQNAGNSYSYPVTVAAGTQSVTIVFSNSNSSNVRFDNVKFYQGQGKKAPGLSWGTASRDVTIGADDNVFPTLTNAYELPVTYSSDNTEVATIAADGTITLVAAGVANISAAFEGNDEYEAQTVSYKLTVKTASTVDISNTPETAYTVSEANALITAGEGLDKKVYVKGTIKSIKEVSLNYGNAEYTITDGTEDLLVYRGYGIGGEKFTSEDDILVGDEVIVYGKLVNYNGTYEFTTGSQLYSLNGQAITGIQNVAAETVKSVRKAIVNGKLVIVKANNTYTVAGQLVK